MYLRERTVAVGVLDARGCRGLAGQQSAHPRGDDLLPGVRAGQVDRCRVWFRGSAHRQQRQRRDQHRGPDQDGQITARQRRLAEGRRVAADEPERLGGAHWEQRGRPGAGLPGSLAQQAEAGRGEGGQVSRPDRAVARDWRGEAAVDGVGQHLQDGRVHTRAARADLIQPHHQHRAGQFRCEQRPGARRVAAEQPQSMLRPVFLVQGDDMVGADTGVPAVHRPGRGHLARHPPRVPRGGHGGRAHPKLSLATRGGGHVRARQRRAVDLDNTAIVPAHGPILGVDSTFPPAGSRPGGGSAAHGLQPGLAGLGGRVSGGQPLTCGPQAAERHLRVPHRGRLATARGGSPHPACRARRHHAARRDRLGPSGPPVTGSAHHLPAPWDIARMIAR